jgi:hypothetical protein
MPTVLTKMLLASPLLREEADQYVLTGPLHTVAIPDTLQDALMARLDQLNRAKNVCTQKGVGYVQDQRGKTLHSPNYAR